ncbi:MAG: hypothetical protein EBV03_13920 [Proteobacteria bacterium]|nr:hypothetical protein [Pseudomonadota bacterium]
MAVIVAAFYHFFDFADFVNTRTPLLETMQALDIKGSVLLAPEGVNGTISGSRESINAFIAHLQEKITHAPITVKESEFAAHPKPQSALDLRPYLARQLENLCLLLLPDALNQYRADRLHLRCDLL